MPSPTLLPVGNYPKQKEGVRTAKDEPIKIDTDVQLAFLEAEEQAVVFAIAEQLQIPDADARLHTKIISHRKKVVEWQKDLKSNEAKGWGKRNMPQAPFLADTVSPETLPRVCRIFDVLIKAMEPLGCSLTDQLNFIVNGETVRVTVTEAKIRYYNYTVKRCRESVPAPLVFWRCDACGVSSEYCWFYSFIVVYYI
ncbi:hypothetical protein AALD74_02280 [Lachnospiraceae bacterium 48-21]